MSHFIVSRRLDEQGTEPEGIGFLRGWCCSTVLGINSKKDVGAVLAGENVPGGVENRFDRMGIKGLTDEIPSSAVLF